MRIETRRTGDSLIVRLTGELDLRLAAAFKSRVRSELQKSQRVRHLLLDLRRVTFIDSSGIGAILGRYREFHDERNGQIVAYGTSPRVRRLLELAGLQRIVTMADTQKQALAMVKEGNPAS